MNRKRKKTKRSIWSILWRTILWLILVLLFVFIVVLLWSNSYLKSDKEKLLRDLPVLNNGTVSFKQADISLIKNFPKASLSFKDLIVHDSLYSEHGQKLAELGEVEAILDLTDWRRKEFTVQQFILTDGDLNIVTLANGYSLLKSILKSGTTFDQTNHKESNQIKFNTDKIDIELNLVRVNVLDSVKTQYLVFELDNSRSTIQIEEDSIAFDLSLDAQIEKLMFKEANGSYLKNARLKGNVNAHLVDETIYIQPCQLEINNAVYDFNGSINLNQNKPTQLHVIQQKTNLQNTIALLPEKIARSIRPYSVASHFPTETHIVLNPGDPAKVTVDFDLNGNDISINNVHFSDTHLKGRFMNRSADRADTKQLVPGSINLVLNDIQTQHKKIYISTHEAVITSDKVNKAGIQSVVNISGPAAVISEWYKNDKLFFERGLFNLQAEIQGPINDLNALLLSSQADLRLEDVDVLYKPADTSIPLNSLELIKHFDDAEFSISSATLMHRDQYYLDGGLHNISALINDLANESTLSQVNFRAPYLAWEDFVHVFSRRSHISDKPLKSEKETKKSLKQTLRMVHDKFDPSIHILIDTFQYLDKVTLYDVNSTVEYLDSNRLELAQTSFHLEQGKVNLEILLNIKNPHKTDFNFSLHTKNLNLEELLPKFDFFNVALLSTQTEHPDDFDLDIQMKGTIDDVIGLEKNTATGTIKFDSKNVQLLNGEIIFSPDSVSGIQTTKLKLKGSPHLFNDFFNNDQFIFQKQGEFNVQFEYDGEVQSFDHLMEKSGISLLIKDGAVLYEGVDIIFPLDKLDLDFQQDTSTYHMFMYSEILNRELYIDGNITNISELIFGNTGEKLYTNVNVYSPIINLEHAFDIFESRPDTTNVNVDEQVDTKMKKLASELLNRFNPHVHVKLDSFIINDQFKLAEFRSGAELQDSTQLVLEQTNFNFFNAKIGLNATADISSDSQTSFRANFTAQELDLHKILKAVDFVGSESLRNAETLEGKIELDLDLKGNFEGLSLIEKDTRAQLKFKIQDLEVKGIDVIDKIAAKLYSTRLFHDIKFAPISNTISVTGSRISIPQMEIMSSGIDLFVEGHIDNKNKTNLWLSIPLDNLTRTPSDVVPHKRTYAGTKRKVYLEMFTDENGKSKTKFRLRKKKFYKQRGIPDQYKIDRKKYRAEYKRLKKLADNE